MNNPGQTTLVLGATGRTGSLVARKLAERGLSARTASRHGADLPFDWDDAASHGPALAGVDRIYLVTPVLRVTYARQVSDFLDLAEAAGVRHVTLLSAYGIDQAPPELDTRAVELDLMSRRGFTSSVLRPAWLMQNFSDDHLPVLADAITVPTGGGAEAFVDAADIAAVAAETLSTPTRMPVRCTRPPGPRRSRWPTSPTSSPKWLADRSGTTTSTAASGLTGPSPQGWCPPNIRSFSPG